MLGFGLVWVKINGHIRQIPYFLKIATEDGFKTVCTLDTFTDSIECVSECNDAKSNQIALLKFKGKPITP
jgi:hypothetical protein